MAQEGLDDGVQHGQGTRWGTRTHLLSGTGKSRRGYFGQSGIGRCVWWQVGQRLIVVSVHLGRTERNRGRTCIHKLSQHKVGGCRLDRDIVNWNRNFLEGPDASVGLLLKQPGVWPLSSPPGSERGGSIYVIQLRKPNAMQNIIEVRENMY